MPKTDHLKEKAREIVMACPAPAVPAAGSRADLHPQSAARYLLLSLGSGIALWLCYFPAACGWLTWMALVPLLFVTRSSLSGGKTFLFGWLAGMVFFWPALQWMRVADSTMYAGWAALATTCALFVGGGLALVRHLDRRSHLPLVLTLPVVWTALEFLRAHLLTGFPWYFLGHTQHDFLALIQVADLGGAYAVSFLVALVNALAFEWLYYLFTKNTAGRRKLWLQTGMAGLVVGGVLAYGAWRLGQGDFETGPRVSLIQGNMDQRTRNAASSPDKGSAEAIETMANHFEQLADQAALDKPDLMVWPETSYPGYWTELPTGRPDGSSKRFAQDAAARWRTNLLLGLNSQVHKTDGATPRFNSAVLIRREGTPAGRYDKIHRVPFGEFVPFVDWLPVMASFVPYDFDYSVHPGESMTRFAVGDHHFGVLICFEDTDPGLARQYARPEGDKPAANFLVNISNDGWFNGTSEHEEHLAICRFRAIECRRAVARAVNMGISAIIDANGRVIVLPGPTWASSKKISAVLTRNIPIDHRTSLYAVWGDWLPWTCWGILGMSLAWAGLPTSWRSRSFMKKK